MQVLNKIN